MKKIEAIIRPFKFEAVKEALSELGIEGMTIVEAKGIGHQKGPTDIYTGDDRKVSMLPKLKIEVILSNEMLKDAVEAIVKSARTGTVGDGKIIISTIDDAIRIRTGEMGQEAVASKARHQTTV
jgi:nitrogen regulatory protein P-II 1